MSVFKAVFYRCLASQLMTMERETVPKYRKTKNNLHRGKEPAISDDQLGVVHVLSNLNVYHPVF